jgi:cytochrome c-type biogenesis protein CcmH
VSRRAASWALLGVVLVAALVVGTRVPGGPPSESQRVHRIASEIRCPTCRGLSAAESDAAAARAVREEILRRVRAGQSDDQIRAFLASRYGDDILLRPPSRGLGALVWVLPTAAVVIAVAGVATALHRWRAGRGRAPTPEDRALVERALDHDR